MRINFVGILLKKSIPNWVNYNLFGEGVLVAIIDSGIDYFHPDFIIIIMQLKV